MEKNQTLSIKYSQTLANEIVKPFFRQWKYPICVIYGNPDTGKTDSALALTEIGLIEGCLDYFASNINTYGKGERITNLEDLDFWFKQQIGRKCYILDEAGQILFSRDALSQLNRMLIKKMMLLRKFHTHIIFVLPEIEHLDVFKDSELTGMIVKKRVREKEFIGIVKTKWHEDLLIVRDFPKTTLPYDTLDISPFTLERQITDEEIALKGLPMQVAYLYAKHGNMAIITRELKQSTGKDWKFQQIKRLLQKYLREQLRIEVKRGRPKKEDGEDKNGEKKPIYGT